MSQILQRIREWLRPPEPPVVGLSVCMLANIGCCWGVENGYDACEVWYDPDDDLLHVSMTDQRLPRHWPNGRPEWGYAYHEGCNPMGTEKEAHFSPIIREWPIDSVRELIDRTFTPPLELVQ